MSNFPTDTLCPVCQTVFQQPRREHGGGARKKYCSSRCRSLDWIRGNGGKRQAAILKYDTKLESVEKKRLRTRKGVLKKYGWIEEQFQAQLVRQNFSCYGCLCSIDEATARIDHNHETGQVRGLLCNNCNWTLGHAHDAPLTLRRLMAYLERDPSKTLVYLIGALKNTRIPLIGNTLRADGYDVMDEWWTPGEGADTHWQWYEHIRGRNYVEALRGRSATNNYSFDRAYLDLCDIAVAVLPAGKSAMLELGYAKGRGKRSVLFLDGYDPDRYDIMPGLADVVYRTETELVEGLHAYRL